jgi:hypothetical protein
MFVLTPWGSLVNLEPRLIRSIDIEQAEDEGKEDVWNLIVYYHQNGRDNRIIAQADTREELECTFDLIKEKIPYLPL